MKNTCHTKKHVLQILVKFVMVLVIVLQMRSCVGTSTPQVLEERLVPKLIRPGRVHEHMVVTVVRFPVLQIKIHIVENGFRSSALQRGFRKET